MIIKHPFSFSWGSYASEKAHALYCELCMLRFPDDRQKISTQPHLSRFCLSKAHGTRACPVHTPTFRYFDATVFCGTSQRDVFVFPGHRAIFLLGCCIKKKKRLANIERLNKKNKKKQVSGNDDHLIALNAPYVSQWICWELEHIQGFCTVPRWNVEVEM